MKPIETVAIFGMGALGSIYAQCFENCQEKFSCWGVVRDVDSYRNDPLIINGKPLSISLSNASDVPKTIDLAIIAVKTYHLKQVIDDLSPLMGEHTQILSLLNGIHSEEMLADAFGWDRVLYAICSGADSNRSGHRVTMNRRGEIYFGEAINEVLSQRVLAVRFAFEQAGVPYRIPMDMLKMLWWKFMINVGMNQVSAVKEMCYGDMRRDQGAMSLMRQAQEEVLLLAQANGVNLTYQDIFRWEELLQTLSSQGRSSTLQDLWQGRKTEVESFGGEVVRRGKMFGIATPVNNMLLGKIIEIESKRPLKS